MSEPTSILDDFVNAPLGEHREIADGVFAVNAAFWGFPNVVYLLRSGTAWALIDSGIAETPELAITPFLEQHGGYEHLELVLGTHGHLDHIGGNAAVKKRAPHARFGVGALDAAWAESPDRHYSDLYEHGAPGGWKPDEATEQFIRGGIGEAVTIDHALVGGEVLNFGDGREIEATHLGAHSPGQMLYTDRATGLVFSGDAVQGAGVLSVESGRRDFPMYRTRRHYLRSLETIRSLRPALLCTAHAGIHPRDEVDAFIDAAIVWGEGFDALLVDLLRSSPAFSLEEVVAAVGARLPEYALGLQVRVTTAEHLDDLVSRGAITEHDTGDEPGGVRPIPTSPPFPETPHHHHTVRRSHHHAEIRTCASGARRSNAAARGLR